MDDVGNKGEIKAVLPRREREIKRRLRSLKMWKRVFLCDFYLAMNLPLELAEQI